MAGARQAAELGWRFVYAAHFDGDPAHIEAAFEAYRALSTQPPLLAVHASRDEYCSYTQMQAFVDRYRDAGNDASLVTVADVGHFFPFYFTPGVQQTREAVAEALAAWEWQGERPAR